MGGARKAFEDLGNDIKHVADDAGRALKEAADRVAAEAQRAAEQVARAAEAEARRIADEVRQVAEQVAAEARRVAEEAAAEAQKIAQAAAEAAQRLAEEAKAAVEAAARQAAETLEREVMAAAHEVAAAAEKLAHDAKEVAEKAIHDAEKALEDVAKHIEAEARAVAQAAIEQARFSEQWVSSHLQKLTEIGPLLEHAGHELGDKLKNAGLDAFDHLPKLDNLHLPSPAQIKNALNYVTHLVKTVTDVGVTVLFTPLKEVAKAVAPHANLSGLDKAENAVKDGLHQAVDNIEGRIDGIVDAGCKAASELGHAYALAKDHKWSEAANSLKEVGKDMLDLGMAFVPPEIEKAAMFASDKLAQGLKFVTMVVDKAVEIGMEVVLHSPVMMLVKLAAPEVAAKVEHAVKAAVDAVVDMVEGTADAAISAVKSGGQMLGALRSGDFDAAGKAALNGAMSAAVVGMTVVDGVAVIAETAAAAVLCDVMPPEAAAILASAVTMTSPRGIAKNITGVIDNFIPTSLVSDAVGSVAKVAGDAAKSAGDIGSSVVAKLGAATGDLASVAAKKLDDIPVTENELLLAGVGAEVAAGSVSSGRKAAPDVGDDVADGAKANAAGKPSKAKESDDLTSKDKDKDKDVSKKDKTDDTDDTDDTKGSKKKKKKDDDDNDSYLGLTQPVNPGVAFNPQPSTRNKLDLLLVDYKARVGSAAASDPASAGKTRVQSGVADRPLGKAIELPRHERQGKPLDAARTPASATTAAVESTNASQPVVTAV